MKAEKTVHDWGERAVIILDSGKTIEVVSTTGEQQEQKTMGEMTKITVMHGEGVIAIKGNRRRVQINETVRLAPGVPYSMGPADENPEAPTEWLVTYEGH